MERVRHFEWTWMDSDSDPPHRTKRISKEPIHPTRKLDSLLWAMKCLISVSLTSIPFVTDCTDLISLITNLMIDRLSLWNLKISSLSRLLFPILVLLLSPVVLTSVRIVYLRKQGHEDLSFPIWFPIGSP